MVGQNNKFWVFSLALLLIFSFSDKAMAAFVYPTAQSQDIVAEDKFLVSLKFDTEGKNINSLEGLVGVYSSDGPVYIRDVNLGGSDFSLWPNKPSVSQGKESSSISFVGGIPGGLNKKDAMLFTISLTAENPGEVFIVPVSLTGYLNDGKGTPTAVNGNQLKLIITKANRPLRDEWQQVITADTEPPLPFSIAIGQDSSIFDGKKFISFMTTDRQSGIDHYEVKEGDRGPVRSGTSYVLQNQDQLEPITVFAFDKAGNMQTATYTASQNTTLFDKILMVVSASILLLVLTFALYTWKTKK
jgi:hypothetical protein